MKKLSLVAVCFLAGVWLPAQEPAAKGAKLIYCSTRNGNAEVYLVNADGKGGTTNLTNDKADDTFPAWSPDGKQIVFTSDRDGTMNLFVMDADGKNVKQLTKETVVSRAPAWSPDGKKIAFTRHIDNGAPDIFVMDADGKNAVNLTNDAGYDADASWSPDGKKIVFTSLRGNSEGFRLYVMNADGKDLKELTAGDNPNGFVYPAWSPDGKRIAFHHRGEKTSVYVMDATGANPTVVIADAELPDEGGRVAWKPK